MARNDRHDLERLGNCLELKIVEAAEVSFSYAGRNRHSFNRIFLVIEEHGGENFIRNHTAGETLPMRAGHICFMPTDTDLEFRFQADMRFISFHFNLELFQHYDVFSGRTRCDSRRDESGVIAELSAILNEPSCGLDALCRLRGLVMQLTAAFIPPERSALDRLDFVARKYEAIFEYIGNRADATTGIDDLAAVSGFSRDRLSREFSRDSGITLKHYLTRALVRRAEKLLLAPDASARSVAEQLKFNNEYYFSRFFRKNTGRTAGEYRRQIRQGESRA